MNYSSDFLEQPTLSGGFRNRRISPGDRSNVNVHSSTMKSIHSGKIKNKKYTRKSCRHKKCIAISQHSVREVNELKNLVNEFLSHKFSAAGVSYIVRSRSRWRKIVWLTAVVISISFMGYMTYNVVKEYMNFPKMLIREEKISPKLAFPAVTLCSLNPIINMTTNESSVYKLIKLKDLIESADLQETNTKHRDDCYIHALCQWSWFYERCDCVNNPCATEFCIAENSTHCACSVNVCRDFTFCNVSKGSDHCVCANSVQYNTELQRNFRQGKYKDDWDEVSKSVHDVMDLIRKAATDDLVDIEEALMPTVGDLLEYGVKFDNLVISCSFDGSSCFRENFTVLYHATYGRCYMFNYLGIKPSSEKPVFAYNYGSSSGLRLVLHVTKQESIDILGTEVGARIVVHDPYSLPFVGEYGINVRPHDMSAIEVKKSTVTRLDPPYGNCVKDGKHLKFKLTTGEPYSILGCQKACRDHYLTQSCSCTKRTYILGSVFYIKATKKKFCKIENTTQYNCMKEVISKIEKEIILCDCLPPCTETLYSTTVSSSDLNENYYRAVKKIRTFYSENGTHKTINTTDNSNLMVGVKVYYSTFQVDGDKEQASYSWETLIANIGGNLGFFMGLTLVTFMEVLEFLWDIIVTSVRRYSESRARAEKQLQMFPSNQFD